MNAKGLQRFAQWPATGFGLGYSPLAPGTAGCLLGVGIAAALRPLPLWAQGGLALLLALIAIPICHSAELSFGLKDDRRIVADEYLTFPICMLGLLGAEWWMYAVAFVVNRICDIVKPPPARRLQDLPGGLGVVIDDVIACLYALALNHALYRGLQLWIAR
jgi:phosphatidylglycerophosphatase A